MFFNKKQKTIPDEKKPYLLDSFDIFSIIDDIYEIPFIDKKLYIVNNNDFQLQIEYFEGNQSQHVNINTINIKCFTANETKSYLFNLNIFPSKKENIYSIEYNHFLLSTQPQYTIEAQDLIRDFVENFDNKDYNQLYTGVKYGL